ITAETDHATGLDLALLQEISAYFREVRKKYVKFEGSLKGIDSRIIMAQVPGGMLTNMENQLREQGASDKIDQVLEEIPTVREDLGFLPLVTPTSQIVGSQAVLNILAGERYKAVTKETTAVLKGEYGATPAPVNKELQKKILKGATPITCRPADLIEPEVEKLTSELRKIASDRALTLAEHEIEDVLTYALFQQVGLKFIENRGTPGAFEPVPTGEELAPAASAPAVSGGETFTVTGGGRSFVVQVANAEGPAAAAAAAVAAGAPLAAAAPAVAADTVCAALAGNIWKIEVTPGQVVEEGDLLFILEAMKMENEVLAEKPGVVAEILVKEGDAVDIGAALLTFVGEKTSAPAASPQVAKAPVAAANGVVAPLAGNIWKLEVAAGQQVQEGDLLIILEAMKMENEIIADRDGTISQLLIKEGDAVDIGQVLLVLE
ncbi:MAG TPA: biotin/lipoyl-containing protein, partial [Desulfurivibrionaceae bacterium]|nr:biotin/lipoyl-containing protein [Desulfurivibrionaceae bacterium]